MNTDHLLKRMLGQALKLIKYTGPDAYISVGDAVYDAVRKEVFELAVAEGLYPNVYEATLEMGAFILKENTDPYGIDVVFEGVHFDFVKTNETAAGANDGTITITNYGGGTGKGYEFSNDNGSTWQASPIFTGLADNTYIVMARDDDNPTPTESLGRYAVIAPGV